MRIIIYSSDKTQWALRPFAYLFNLYWSSDQYVSVYGNSLPRFTLPHNFTFKSIGPFRPAEYWSDDLIAALHDIKDDVICLLMDDYWLNRQVNQQAVTWCYEYMLDHPEVIRFDLTTDRLYAKGVQPYGPLGYLDLIKSDPRSPYNFSLQGALWRRKLLLDLLIPHETPWQVEDNGSNRLIDKPYIVLGTKQSPIHYTIAVQKGKLALDGGYQTPTNAMQQTDVNYILNSGWLPQELAAYA